MITRQLLSQTATYFSGSEHVQYSSGTLNYVYFKCIVSSNRNIHFVHVNIDAAVYGESLCE